MKFALYLPIVGIICLLVTGTGCQTTPLPNPEVISQTPPETVVTATEEELSSVVITPILEPSETAVPIPEDTEISEKTAVESPIAQLQNLPIDAFFEESYLLFVRRRPEQITRMGMAAELGVRNDGLDNLSDEYLRETQMLETAVLDLLHTYDRSSLTSEQQTSYDVYEWYLDNQIQGHPFMYHDYPITHFLGSYQDGLLRLITELHPMTTKEDAEDYISRVSQINIQVEQLMEGLEIREEMGIIPPKHILDMAQGQYIEHLNLRSSDPASIDPETLEVYTVFAEKLEEIEGLSEAEKQMLLEDARIATEKVFIPAFVTLLDYINHLLPLADDDIGLWKLPDGDAYYAYLLRDQTTTNMSPDEIHELGLVEVARIQSELRQLYDELGYPADESRQASIDRAIDEAGYINISTQAGKDEYTTAVIELVAETQTAFDEYFDMSPSNEVVVVPGPWGGYYVPGTPDGSRPGAYHISVSGQWKSKYDIPTIAYHEAVPGHHFQIALAQEMDMPLLRNDIVFNAYAEGWALYAERLAKEAGLYADDPYGDIGRLQFELLRGVRLVTDTGIHAKGWTRQEAKQYMDETMGKPGWFSHEVDRYIAMPGQATGYKIGMNKILELREQEMTRLGDEFDIKAFHNTVLGSGSVPLEILEQIVSDGGD